MAVDVSIPALGESVSEGVIVRWIKHNGEPVAADDPLFELETDKASVEIPAPSAGVITILVQEGATVHVGDVVARIDGDGAAARRPAASPAPPAPAPSPTAAPTPAATPPPPAATATPAASQPLSPAVRRLVEEHRLDPQQIAGTGRGGRLTKDDVLAHLSAARREAAAATPADAPPAASPPPPATAEAPRPPTPYPPRPDQPPPNGSPHDDVERVPMTRLRQRIAERLRQAQATAAILTTFNEVDMSVVMELRTRFKTRFSEVHGVSLGFMSFFAHACVAALRNLPLVNAQIDGTDIVYNRRVHLGVAVGTERGLVVPVVHNADLLSFAEIEKEIARLAGLARDNKLGIDDLSGGTFTISNGGVYGSLLSTPILNPPQSAILGMHKIEKRPIVVNDEIVIRPMMYLALSYDHRLIDGAEAVTFLVKVKERLEEPSRLLLGV
jgi:2-oxoglutarate dehydrogenase E2 component (dihydrolipoamide succinyltransferase)